MKNREYIIENSELRVKLQRLTAQHEKEMKDKEEEYSVGKKVLEEEYKKRVHQNEEMMTRVNQLEMEMSSNAQAVYELQEVISAQKEEIEEIKEVEIVKRCNS